MRCVCDIISSMMVPNREISRLDHVGSVLGSFILFKSRIVCILHVSMIMRVYLLCVMVFSILVMRHGVVWSVYSSFLERAWFV